MRRSSYTTLSFVNHQHDLHHHSINDFIPALALLVAHVAQRHQRQYPKNREEDQDVAKVSPHVAVFDVEGLVKVVLDRRVTH